ncbi:hypothetical protein AB4Y42_44345, partial [Paraburkholderia sp. EG286B]|uniref:hypothetical protein n=1 Tax=Paraburkholderia sp. EG286B TaxID=3237011 RepID=UPI0034D22AE2
MRAGRWTLNDPEETYSISKNQSAFNLISAPDESFIALELGHQGACVGPRIARGGTLNSRFWPRLRAQENKYAHERPGGQACEVHLAPRKFA